MSLQHMGGRTGTQEALTFIDRRKAAAQAGSLVPEPDSKIRQCLVPCLAITELLLNVNA